MTFGIATTRLIIDGYLFFLKKKIKILSKLNQSELPLIIRYFRVVPWNPRNVIAEESFEATTYEYDGHAIWIDCFFYLFLLDFF